MWLERRSFRFMRTRQHVGRHPRNDSIQDLAPIVLTKDIMHQLNREAARQHELAAKSHREAAKSHALHDDSAGQSHADHALHSANRAYELARQAHDESDQSESL